MSTQASLATAGANAGHTTTASVSASTQTGAQPTGKRRTTRKLHEVADVDLIQCNICGGWKEARENFTINSHKEAVLRYSNRCHGCQKIRNSLRVRHNGKRIAPSNAEVRAAISSGATPTAPGKLAFVGHSRRDPEIPSDAEVAARKLLREAKAEREGTEGFLYLIAEGEVTRPEAATRVKMGYSVDPDARCGELQTGNPRPLKLLAKVKGTREKERELHQKHIQFNILGEWFWGNTHIFKEFGINYER